MTPLETIAAAAVAIFGIWLLGPLLIFVGFVILVGIVLGGLAAVDAWQEHSDRKRSARKREKR